MPWIWTVEKGDSEKLMAEGVGLRREKESDSEQAKLDFLNAEHFFSL